MPAASDTIKSPFARPKMRGDIAIRREARNTIFSWMNLTVISIKIKINYIRSQSLDWTAPKCACACARNRLEIGRNVTYRRRDAERKISWRCISSSGIRGQWRVVWEIWNPFHSHLYRRCKALSFYHGMTPISPVLDCETWCCCWPIRLHCSPRWLNRLVCSLMTMLGNSRWIWTMAISPLSLWTWLTLYRQIN